MIMARCSQYWSFLILTSGFGFCMGMWVASETPLIIRTLRSVLVVDNVVDNGFGDAVDEDGDPKKSEP